MCSAAEVDVLLVALLTAVLATAVASPRHRRHFYDAEYEDYYHEYRKGTAIIFRLTSSRIRGLLPVLLECYQRTMRRTI